MMIMILNHMLREFRENSNGRGPDSIELLEMRKALAGELGVSNVAGPPLSQHSSSGEDSNDNINDMMSSKEGNQKVEKKEKRERKVVMAEEITPHRHRSSSCSSGEEEEEEVRILKQPAPGDNDEQEQGRHSGIKKKA